MKNPGGEPQLAVRLPSPSIPASSVPVLPSRVRNGAAQRGKFSGDDTVDVPPQLVPR
jgi:hypothetical protein